MIFLSFLHQTPQQEADNFLSAKIVTSPYRANIFFAEDDRKANLSNFDGRGRELLGVVEYSPLHGCLKWLFIDFFDKKSYLTSQNVGNLVQISKYVKLMRDQPILKLKSLQLKVYSLYSRLKLFIGDFYKF